MQFVFGDNTTKYTMLYFDDKPDAAEKAQSLVQMSYSPNPDFDSVGFVPFGANNTRALFFKFCKDFKMKRNVYFLHGVYSDVDPEYFYGRNYVYGLFTQFLNQEKFDVLRDQVLAGENGDVAYGFDKALAETPYDQIAVENADLHGILTRLYQRKGVVMVMDDDKFSNDRALLLIKKIFHYLPPSLRKLCSYVTAVDDTGSMDFMLRIIPRSMLKLKEEHVDLDNQSSLYKDKTNFTSIAASLMTMSDGEREEVFRLYEMFYFGRDSIYKKQNFERFYLCYTGSNGDAEAVKLCDELMTDYLDNPKLPENPEIPNFLRDALTARYSSQESLDRLVDWDPKNLAYMDKFCDINADVMRKVYYLCDRGLTYFRSKLEGMFLRTYVSADIEKLREFYSTAMNIGRTMTDVKLHEKQYLQIMGAGILPYLDKVVKNYRDLKAQTKACTEEYLQKNCKNGANEPRAVLNYVLSIVGSKMAEVRPLVTDVDEELERTVLFDIICPYNDRVNEAKRQRREQQDRDMKNNIYLAFVYRLDKDAGVQELEPPVDASAEDLSVDDLYLVAEDEQLCPMLAQKIADYIVSMCAAGDQGVFKFNSNKHLKLAKHMKLCFQVAKDLCKKGAVDYAVLYLMAYHPRCDAAVKYILKMAELDQLDSRGLTNLKNLMPALLNRRRNRDNLSNEELEDLQDKADEVLKDKSSSKPRRTVAIMVQDMIVGGPTILERERKRNLILAICAGVGALLLIGVLVAVILLGGGKDNDSNVDDGTKAPQSTTVPADPTDPTDPPACEEHTYNDVTVGATCTEPGSKTYTCTVCSYSYTEEVAATGHAYENGVCTNCNAVCSPHEYKGGVCTVCNLKCTEHNFAAPEGSEKSFCSECGLCEEHADEDWAEATCTEPKTCKTCGLTDGEALGHTWVEATCETAKTCSVCDASEGEALGHDWADATCQDPKTCKVCRATDGDALGHTWEDATCTEPETCSVCDASEGEALGHTWVEATCTEPQTCFVCGAIEGEALGHKSGESNYVVGSCGDEIIKEYTCETCGDQYEDIGPADGHILGDDGKCSVCNADNENGAADAE